MKTTFEKTFEMFLPILRDEQDPVLRAEIEATIRKGCKIVPFSQLIKNKVAKCYDVAPEKLDDLSDDGILNLAFKQLDDDRIVEALIFHASVVAGVWGAMFDFQKL